MTSQFRGHNTKLFTAPIHNCQMGERPVISIRPVISDQYKPSTWKLERKYDCRSLRGFCKKKGDGEYPTLLRKAMLRYEVQASSKEFPMIK